MSSLSHQRSKPVFPETMHDEKIYQITKSSRFLKATIGWTAFFTVFEGLQHMILTSKKELGSIYHVSHFIAGGISGSILLILLLGMTFLATNASLGKTPVQLDWTIAIRTVPRTFLFCGIGGVALGLIKRE